MNPIISEVIKHAQRLFKIEHVSIQVDIADELTNKDAEAELLMVAGDLFIVRIKPIVFEDDVYLVEVLGHELTHVKQYVQDDLDLFEDYATFRGKQYRFMNEAEYRLSPWEVEAYGMQQYFIWRFFK